MCLNTDPSLRGMELDGDGGWGKENDEPERSSLKARVPGSTPRELSFRPTRALRVGPKRMLGKLGPRAGKRMGDPSISAADSNPQGLIRRLDG